MKQIVIIICFFSVLYGCKESYINEPRELRAVFVSERLVILDWKDRSDNEEGFEIERADGDEPFRVIGKTAANMETFTDEDVIENRKYHYRVRAFDELDHSPYSNMIEIQTITGWNDPPDPPDELSVSYFTRTTVQLSWIDQSDNETHFQIERSENPDFTDVTPIILIAQNYMDRDLVPGKTYHYRITAVNSFGQSEYSNEISVTTVSQEIPLIEPSDLDQKDSSQTTIHIIWTDTNENEEGFIVKRSLDGENFTVIATTDYNITEFIDVGLLPGLTFSYTVEAFDGELSSPPSPVLAAQTEPVSLDPPFSPSDLTGISTIPHRIDLNWSDNSDNEDGFIIERSADPAFLNSSLFTLAGPDQTAYSDSYEIESGTLYYYRIAAFNLFGTSGYSNEITVETPAIEIPIIPPSSLYAGEITESSITIIWQDHSDNEDGFSIEQSTEGTSFEEIQRVGSDITEFTATNLSEQSIYYYRVRAFSEDRFSDYSNTISATTLSLPPPLPDTPSDLSAEVISSAQIDLSWIDRSSVEDGFRLERSITDDFQNPERIFIDHDILTYSDTGLLPGTRYYFRIVAYNLSGESGYSNTTEAVTHEESIPVKQPKWIADHTVAKESILRRIPAWAINQAKDKLHIMYSGTSHSRQVMQGMRGLKAYKPGDDTLFDFTYRGGPLKGALDIDYNFDGKTAWDLSQDSVDGNGHTGYFRDTVRYLDTHPNANVVMWSWCSIEGHDVEIYLKNFEELIGMYKAGGSKDRTEETKVTFVFMTGYARGDDGDIPESPYIRSPYQNHKRIVDFCNSKGYFCLDYWSQDTYGYENDFYKPKENGNANVQHHAWISNPGNIEGEKWFVCRNYTTGAVQYPEHTADNPNLAQHLTGNRRAYAAWWLFARIAGWDGTLE